MNVPVIPSRNKREGHYGGRIKGFNIRGWPKARVDNLRGLASQPDSQEKE